MEPLLKYAILCLLLLIWGIICICLRRNKFKLCTQQTNAVITAVEERYHFEGTDAMRSSNNNYCAVYEYEVNGSMYQQRGNRYTQNRHFYRLGEETKLFFNPKNPMEFYTEKEGKGYSFGITLLIFSVIAFLIGLAATL